MKILKQVLALILWLFFWGLTTPLLTVVSLLALWRGKQEQFFVQKPIFDPGRLHTPRVI